MIAKQCIFVDEEKVVHPGIHCVEDNGDNYIICLCCGGIVDPKEVVLKDFENWMTFDTLEDIAEERKRQRIDGFAKGRKSHSRISGKLRRH